MAKVAYIAPCCETSDVSQRELICVSGEGLGTVSHEGFSDQEEDFIW